MRKLLLMLMMLVLSIPIWAGEKTVTISRNEGIYKDSQGVYYCSKDGITMTFSSGMNNINYLVEHQQVIFYIRSDNYVIKKIKFNCLDNTTSSNLDCFYWGPSTMHELEAVATYTPTGTYTSSGYIGTWVAGTTDSKDVKFRTEGKPVRFGSVEITIDKEFGDIYEKVTQTSEVEDGMTYALVSQYSSKALGKEVYYSETENLTTFSSTPVTLLDNMSRVKVTDEVQLIKLQSTGNTSRPWYIKVGDNYMRRRSSMSGSGGAANGQGYNLHTVSNVPSGSEQYFQTSISIGGASYNNNALIRFSHTSTETANGETFAIRHYNGGSLFRDLDYNTSNNQYANNQRVYLYKPAQSYEVTKECIPTNGGYITLGGGILTDDQGRNWSQHFDNVTFFVGPTDGYGIGEVTMTDINTRAVTVLQPTASSDFGNDYSFEMPANDVKITANFLSPLEIDTICNPANGGQFNFINGYTNFNGQYYSNEGKTVTFKPTAADGYIFQSVTITDNGVTTTMTPDADGVYSFVMSDNSVTLTANFEEAHDLYLLGTANGRTGWVPSGPKFTYDGTNQKYYIDVYFKGGNDDANVDPAYGYFSLTKKIDEGGNWNNIAAYRLAAETNNKWVEDGDTGIALYGDRNDNAFKIKPGVYRIEVNAAMAEMSIIEYPLSLSFNPESGVVELNTEVTISSNLEELVHNINRNEIDASFFNTTDNWATQENDNTRVIDHEGVTTVKASATLGYIVVNGQAEYEVLSDLYLLGTANGRSSWLPYGPKFTYDANAEEYYIDVYFKGYNDDTNADDGYGYFSLSTRIGSDDNDWNSINGYRLFATSQDYPVEDGNTYNDCFQTSTDHAFKIPAGVYRITVNKAKTQMSITEYPLTLTFDPASGTTVASGDNVTITSNLDALVHAINPDEENASFKNSTDGGTTWDNDNTATITAVGTTTTVNAEANIGYITVTGTATYTIPAPAVYNITTVVTPTGAGTVNVQGTATEGETVEFTITNSSSTAYDDYNIYAVTLTTNDSQETITLTPTNGTYSFVMPSEDVTITVEYRKEFMVRISCTPENGGVVGIERPDGELTSMTYKMEGETVTFYVAPNPNFKLVSITSYNSYFNYTDNGDGYYSFVMPRSQVIINVTFEPVGEYQVNVVNDPTEAGSTSLSGHVKTEGGNYYSDEDETVVITPTPATGWAVSTVDAVDAQNNPVAVTANGDGTYSLVMPASAVTITTHYVRAPFTITTQVNPEGKGTITLMGDAADYDEIAFQTVTFSVEPVLDYVISSVYYTIVTGSTHYPVTDNGDGTYSFVMPESNVKIVAELKEAERIFRRIKHHRDIIEGGKYVYVDYYDGVVMGREYADKPNVLGDVFPKQMLDGGERVSVFSNAAVFEIVNLVDTTYNPQSLDYGWLGEVPYKAAYLKMVDDGSYIGLPDNPVFPYAAELFDVDNPNEKFENLRVLLRVEDRRGFWQNHLSMNEATWSYYPYVWPHPLISKEYHEGEYLKWNIGYSSEHETFYVGRDHPIYLYKMPQPFTVTTRCVEQGWGDIQLSGVDGNIAMDGDVVTVTPVAATGYGFVELTVTINGTGEVLDVTDNHDGTYSFVMPAADVTVTATYGPAHRLTLTVAPESIGHCVYSSLVIGDADIDFMGETPTYYQQNDILPNVPVNFDIRLDDYYAIKSVTITNDNTGEVSEFLRYEIDNDEDPGYLCLFGFNMPNNNATVTVNVIPGHKVTCVPMLYDSESGDYVEVDPDQCGRIVVEHLDSDGYYRSGPIYFEKDDEMAVGVTHNEGYRLDHVTAVCDATGEVIVLTVSYEDMLPGFYSEAFYEFSMPDADVTFTAYFVPFTPLALIEKPNGSENGFIDDDPVTVDDELIGVWAVANPETGEKLLWAKDQSPYRSYDWVERPEGTIDYVRQNMKLQKKDWSQSNWVVLDFGNLFELWEGSEESFNQKMEDLVDHKIIAGTVKGTYHCEGDVVKAKHRIVLDEWPQAVNPNDVTSLGYPGYAEDPKEEKAYDYKYNHYVPANFMQKYVSGLYGGLQPGDDGIVPGAEAGNPDYADKRWFFMKPKDAEVAQVWAVWLGSYELYDEFSDETRDGHVFETYVSDPDNGVNMYDFGGAFFVPSWDYNRWTTGDGVDHYGFPECEVSLVVNTDYLFHVAIETHGEKDEDDQPVSAPRRGQGTQAREDAPWSYYSVYPLDLDPTNSTTTGLNEVNAPASTTIDSIRYYNVMGQESKTPFDGINIMVIRYKDGSMISKKILR